MGRNRYRDRLVAVAVGMAVLAGAGVVYDAASRPQHEAAGDDEGAPPPLPDVSVAPSPEAHEWQPMGGTGWEAPKATGRSLSKPLRLVGGVVRPQGTPGPLPTPGSSTVPLPPEPSASPTPEPTPSESRKPKKPKKCKKPKVRINIKLKVVPNGTDAGAGGGGRRLDGSYRGELPCVPR